MYKYTVSGIVCALLSSADCDRQTRLMSCPRCDVTIPLPPCVILHCHRTARRKSWVKKPVCVF